MCRCFVVVVVLLTGCATTIQPNRVGLNTVEVKINNPESGKNYILHSNISNESVLSRSRNSDGFMYFDISNFSKKPSECYFVSDGKEKIPTISNKFHFPNPVVGEYFDAEKRFNNNQASLNHYRSILDKNAAYRDSQCVSYANLSVPDKPLAACANPDEAEVYSTMECQYIADGQDKSVWSLEIFGIDFSENIKKAGCWTGAALTSAGTAIATAGWSAVFASAAVGTATERACNAYLDDFQKSTKHNKCLVAKFKECGRNYDEWLSDVNKRNYLKENAESLYNECSAAQSNVTSFTETMNELKTSLDQVAQSWVQLTDKDACQ